MSDKFFPLQTFRSSNLVKVKPECKELLKIKFDTEGCLFRYYASFSRINNVYRVNYTILAHPLAGKMETCSYILDFALEQKDLALGNFHELKKCFEETEIDVLSWERREHTEIEMIKILDAWHLSHPK